MGHYPEEVAMVMLLKSHGLKILLSPVKRLMIAVTTKIERNALRMRSVHGIKMINCVKKLALEKIVKRRNAQTLQIKRYVRKLRDVHMTRKKKFAWTRRNH